ncbi:hypothetical protein LMG3482_06236 [Achromobacter deleyi]|nr:hypothetical protein LMG3482_06236 [Achromobacter deleyi]
MRGTKLMPMPAPDWRCATRTQRLLASPSWLPACQWNLMRTSPRLLRRISSLCLGCVPPSASVTTAVCTPWTEGAPPRRAPRVAGKAGRQGRSQRTASKRLA